MKKNYDRRQFVKLASKVAIGSTLFPACSTSSKKEFSFRSISSDSNTFDYIIVGSGAGGGPVVARLAEAGFRVLLIEAGGSKTKEEMEIPAFHGIATESESFSWEFFVKHYEKRIYNERNSKFDQTKNGVFYPRATGLGGCTTHNAMITMYPDNDDWNHIENLTGDRSWNARAMRKYFQKVENNQYYDEPQKSRSLMTLLNRERMGFNGWLGTEQTSRLFLLRDTKFIKIFLSALKEEGIIDEAVDILADVKNTRLDPNTWSYVQKKLDGILNVPKATMNGKRISTRDLILETKRKYPKNLTIKTHTLAHKVILDENKRAIGVEVFENSSGNNLYEASPSYSKSFQKSKKYYKCSREVILAGGAFNSPQLLMLSGIGEKEELDKVGIRTEVSLPGVGKNLQDRYEITVCSEMKEDFTVLKDCTFGEKGDPCLVDYKKDPKSSVYGTNGVITSLVKTSRGRVGDPDLFIFGLPGLFKGYYKGWSKDVLKSNYFTWAILKGHNNNQSGTINLKSSSPFERPEVQFRYFQDSKQDYLNDLDAVMEGVGIVRNINKRMKSQIKREVFPGDTVVDYPKLRNWIQKEAWGHHASCSNKIGADNDPLSVLDSKFRVRGTKGLRVVDASSFNKVPGLFIVLPIYMIAEKAAEDIIEAAKDFS